MTTIAQTLEISQQHGAEQVTRIEDDQIIGKHFIMHEKCCNIRRAVCMQLAFF